MTAAPAGSTLIADLSFSAGASFLPDVPSEGGSSFFVRGVLCAQRGGKDERDDEAEDFFHITEE